MQITVKNENGNLWVIRLAGLATKAGLDAAIIRLWEQAGAGTKIRQLVILEGFEGWEKSQAWDDMSLAETYGDDVDKIAIVGEPKWETEAKMFLGAGFRRTAIEFFPSGQEAQARAWIDAAK